VLLGVCLLCVLVLEVAVRILLPRPGSLPLPPNGAPGMLVPHPHRDYAYAPGFEGEIELAGGRQRIVINRLGLRDEPVKPGERITILAAGDSFTAGFGVAAHEAWPERLERQLEDATPAESPRRVLNAGVSGYSLVQIRKTIEELLPLEPGLVVLGLYPQAYTRIEDPFVFFAGGCVQRSETPYLRPSGQALLYSRFEHRALRSLHYWTIEHFELAAHALRAIKNLDRRWPSRRRLERDVGPAAQRLTGLLEELDRIADSLAARRVPLVVLLISEQSADGSFAEESREYRRVVVDHCVRRGLVVVDPLPRFERASGDRRSLRFADDHHWTARAHDLAARVLAEELREHGLVPGAGPLSSEPGPASSARP
jgi:hypothetical protein